MTSVVVWGGYGHRSCRNGVHICESETAVVGADVDAGVQIPTECSKTLPIIICCRWWSLSSSSVITHCFTSSALLLAKVRFWCCRRQLLNEEGTQDSGVGVDIGDVRIQ